MTVRGGKKLLLLVLGALFWNSCAVLQEVRRTEEPPGPRMVFEKPVYDFGFAGPEQEVAHTFRFTNTGSETLLIDKVAADCGFSAPWISGDAIPPGATGEIRTLLATPRYEGRQEKHLTVYSNASLAPESLLTIQGTIRRHVAVVPQGISFGEVARGDSPARQIQLLQLSRDPLELHKVAADDRYFSVKSARFREENSRGFRIDVALKPEAPTGVVNRVITLHTNMKARPRIDVLVWADVRE